MIVKLLTEKQKESLIGKEYKPDCYFNPIQDANGNWVISNDEVIHCINPAFLWVNELPVIDYLKASEPNILTN